MKMKTILLLLLLATAVMVSGCTSAPGNTGEVKSPEQVTESLNDVSTGVEDIGSTLDEIGQKLG